MLAPILLGLNQVATSFTKCPVDFAARCNRSLSRLVSDGAATVFSWFFDTRTTDQTYSSRNLYYVLESVEPGTQPQVRLGMRCAQGEMEAVKGTMPGLRETGKNVYR